MLQKYFFSYFSRWAAVQPAVKNWYEKQQVKEVEMKDFFDRLLECYANEKIKL
jgi:hypothetical protein